MTYVPQNSVEGTAHECGRQLGYVWQDALVRGAAQVDSDSKPYWSDKRYRKLVDRYAPHLPDVYRGMAKTSGLSEDRVGSRAVDLDGGCTSWAIAPDATLDGEPISGQTKDTPTQRLHQFQVLRFKCSDAPSALTLTYAGWLFGHGFVEGGCSIFRNSLYGGSCGKGLTYGIYGLLALHCKTVDDAVELAQRHGVAHGFHATIADSHGGIVGMEATSKGISILKPKRGIYVHANAIVNARRAAAVEVEDKQFRRADSVKRVERLTERLSTDRGRLTPQLAMYTMSDHGGYPTSVCRHQSDSAFTTAAVVVEPTRGLLHCTRGQPCRNWAKTYAL